MTRPKCNQVASPASGHEQVKIVESSLTMLTDVSADEARTAIIAALHRWNQQSESGVYFSYAGSASAPVRQNKGCGSSCNGLNTVHIEALCEGRPAYFKQRCRGDTLCVLNNTYHQWLIALCKTSYDADSPAIQRHYNWSTGAAFWPGVVDITAMMMHELGHAQGLGHPGAHLVSDPNEPGAYCTGDAAVMGGPHCGSVSVASGRDLYRYDQVCSEEIKGIRKLKIHHVTENNGIFSSSTLSVPGGASNVAAWQSVSGTRADIYTGPANISWWNFPALNIKYSSRVDDDLLSTRQVASIGIPNNNSRDRRMTVFNHGSHTDWNQHYEAKAFDTDSGEWRSQTFCGDSSCTERQKIYSLYPIEITEAHHPTATHYGTWVESDRSSLEVNRVRIARKIATSDDTQFGHDLFTFGVDTATKPTLVCNPTVCALYHVPEEDGLGRIHVQFLVRNSTSGLLAPFFDVGAIPVSDSDGATFSTGSNLTSWSRVDANGKTVVYLAFVSNDVNFPVRVLKLQLLSGSNVISSHTFGTSFSSLSVSRNVPNNVPASLVWTGP